MRLKKVVAAVAAILCFGTYISTVDLFSPSTYTAYAEIPSDIYLTGKGQEIGADCTYEVEYYSDGTLHVTWVEKSSGDVVIPSTINGKKVRSLIFNSNAFGRFSSITIPEGVDFVNWGVGIGGKTLYTLVEAATEMQSWGTDGVKLIVGSTEIQPLKPPSFDYDEETATLTISGDGRMLQEYVSEDPFFSYFDSNLDSGTSIEIKYPYADYKSDVKRVIIGSGITKIDACAFSNFKSLESIEIPDTVTEIGKGAFNNCKALNSLEIPDSVKKIEDFAFRNCSNLEEIKMPGELTGITGNRVFINCTSLKSITLPESMTIGMYCFYNCTSLEEIIIPNSVDFNYVSGSGGLDAFRGTPWLENQPDGMLYVGKTAYMYIGDIPESTVIDIKSGTEIIGKYAFDNCEGITEINIPSSVNSILTPVFCDSTVLKSINVDSENETFYSIDGILYEYAREIFHNSDALTNGIVRCPPQAEKVTIPKNVQFIYRGAFKDCVNLESLYLPSSVYLMSNYGESVGIFQNCKNLKDVTIDVGESASFNAFYCLGDLFRDCENLISFKFIGEYDTKSNSSLYETFKNCTSLTDVDIPYFLRLSTRTFYGCKSLKSVKLPDGTYSIPDEAFSGCTALEDIIIPNSVTSIASGAFRECISLKKVVIPENVTVIRSFAFEGCNLESIIIKNPDCTIEDRADTIGLKKEKVYGDNPHYEYGVIYGYEGSTAQAYAEKYGYKFALIEDDFMSGDANSDGLVNVADAVAVLQYIANADKYPITNTEAADCDGIAGITGNDAVAIQKYDAKIVDSLPLTA